MNTTHTLRSLSENQRKEESIENQWRSFWPEVSMAEYVTLLVKCLNIDINSLYSSISLILVMFVSLPSAFCVWPNISDQYEFPNTGKS